LATNLERSDYLIVYKNRDYRDSVLCDQPIKPTVSNLTAMIKSIIFGTITLFAAIFVIFSTKFGIAKLIEKLLYFTGPAITLAILVGSLFIFFAFFAARFFSWYHNEPRNESGRKTWTISLVQSMNLMLGIAAAVVILDSCETTLNLAAPIS
jgi:hypothetical protein